MKEQIFNHNDLQEAPVPQLPIKPKRHLTEEHKRAIGKGQKRNRQKRDEMARQANERNRKAMSESIGPDANISQSIDYHGSDPTDLLTATTRFHTLAELPTGEFVPTGTLARPYPKTMEGNDPSTGATYLALRTLRRELLREEYREYRDGEIVSDIIEITDGLLDIIVVAWGTLLAYVGEDRALAAAAEVARSNLSKVDGTLGPIVRRDDGKLLKPEGWTSPDIKGALGL